MNLQKCKNGHYYDQDKFVRCPFCAAKKMPLKDTLVLDGAADAHTKREGSFPKGWRTENGAYAEETNPKVSLKDAVAAAMKKRQDWELAATDQTASASLSFIQTSGASPKRDDRLPVGILVTIEGVRKGGIYLLTNGENYLYMKQGDLYIRGDVEEGNPQASVFYDFEQNLFVLQLLEETANICIGKMTLEDSVRLVPYDTIVIGDTILLFVPICGDQFRWG